MSYSLYRNPRRDKPHARLYQADLVHPAWIGLSGNAYKLIARLLADYRDTQANSFPVGGRTVAVMIGVSEKTAKKVVDELIEKGHLREQRAGRNRGFVKTRERVVSLTRYDTETSVGDPKLPIKIWKQNQTR